MNRSVALLGGTIAMLALFATACTKRETRDDTVATVRSEVLLSQTVEVSAGGYHSCARLQTGAVMCWGEGEEGQLGDGAFAASPTPVIVSNLSDAVVISAGFAHSCALRSDHTVACWGRGTSGQLGNGALSSSAVPVVVTGLADAVAVSAGGIHSCAVRANGAVVCWGSADFGQLGNGGYTQSAVPVAVSGLFDAVSVAAGGLHSCARRTTGEVVCWGNGDNGQLGGPFLGDPNPNALQISPVPITAFGLSDAIAGPGAGAYASCAIRATGQVVCWGNSYPDAVGGSVSPVLVSGLSDAVSIAVGYGFACALRRTGAVACWGGSVGGLGDGSTTNSETPIAVSGLSDAIGVSASFFHACAVRENGGVVCWGQGAQGQLGDGRSLGTTRPMTVSGISNATALSTGDDHSCAVRSTGQLACWGYNGFGQLGPGTTNVPFAYAPIAVAGIANASSVTAGDAHTCVVRATGTVACWGWNATGQLGDGTFDTPAATATVSGISDARSVAAGGEHTCAVRANGTVACWGWGEGGELGDGHSTSSNVPVTVSGLADATAVAVGRVQVCALRGSGGVVCWGVGTSGQLGNGSFASSAVPVSVSNLSDATAIAAGDQSICALRATGGVVCWGHGDAGQLGDGVQTDSAVPVTVSGLTDAVAIAVGKQHACAVRATGAAVCWGRGDVGQLGNGSTVSASEVPVPVSTLSDALLIGAGANTTCALRRTGAIVCWGRGDGGQLGNGFLPYALAPVAVALPDGDLGALCSDGSQCARGFCVDGVCCADACVGGIGDCQACSIAAGGAADGTCTPTVVATPCGDDGSVCTLDLCDGTSTTCQHTPGNAGQVCSNVDACESTEICSGSSATCPAPTTLPAQNCSPVTSSAATIGFLGWRDNDDVRNNPVGSVLLIFNGLTTPGTASVVESSDGPDLPAGFQTVGADHPHYWHIETSAKYTSLTVCIRYDDTWLGSSNEMMLQLWHYNTDDGIFENKTNVGFPQPNTNVICGNVTKLSPFALVLPVDTTPPTLPSVADVTAYATTTAGAAVSYTVPPATDAMDPSPHVDCAPASNSLFPPGKTTVTCTATDTARNTATASFTVWVQYQAPTNGSFFLQPINPDGSSLFKRGSTIPVKFKLQGASAGIASLVAHLSVAKVAQGVSGTYVEAVSTAASDGGDAFRYDAAANQYIFNLSTKALTIGTWLLRADLGDRVEHVVNVSLR